VVPRHHLAGLDPRRVGEAFRTDTDIYTNRVYTLSVMDSESTTEVNPFRAEQLRKLLGQSLTRLIPRAEQVTYYIPHVDLLEGEFGVGTRLWIVKQLTWYFVPEKPITQLKHEARNITFIPQVGSVDTAKNIDEKDK